MTTSSNNPNADPLERKVPSLPPVCKKKERMEQIARFLWMSDSLRVVFRNMPGNLLRDSLFLSSMAETFSPLVPMITEHLMSNDARKYSGYSSSDSAFAKACCHKSVKICQHIFDHYLLTGCGISTGIQNACRRKNFIVLEWAIKCLKPATVDMRSALQEAVDDPGLVVVQLLAKAKANYKSRPPDHEKV